jgi:hypothetical protein
VLAGVAAAPATPSKVTRHTSAVPAAARPLRTSEALAAVGPSLPFDDILDTLLARFPDRRLVEILGGYADLVNADTLVADRSRVPKWRWHGSVGIVSPAVRLSPRRAPLRKAAP